MKINRFINNPAKPFHTSGFARAVNGDSIGAASPETFERRQRIDRNRRAVRKYGESHIGQAALPDRMQVQAAITRPVDIPVPTVSRQRYNAGDMPAGRARPHIPIRPSFTEPTPRRFNPFE